MMSETSKKQRILGGLWGAIVGDALGVPVEFTAREERRRDPVTDMRGYGAHNQPPGTWSDDSSLLLCTVEALCDKEYHAERMGALFLRWQERGHWTPYGKVFDIGNATAAALVRMRQGVPAEKAGGVEERDNGNGSLMRILPVALRYAGAPIDEMLFRAHRISGLTHLHPRSQMACGLYCCVARGLLDGLTPQAACRMMINHCQRYYNVVPFQAEYPHFARIFTDKLAALPEAEIKSSGYVVHTLEAALWCLLTTTSFEEAVLKAVNLGDDTDTTGCVAGGLAGITYGREAIPAAWWEPLARKEDIAKCFERFLWTQSRG